MNEEIVKKYKITEIVYDTYDEESESRSMTSMVIGNQMNNRNRKK